MNRLNPASAVGLCALLLLTTAIDGFQQTNSIQGRLRSPPPLRHEETLAASLGSAVSDTSRSAALDWSFLDGVYLITCPNADPNGERLARAKGVLCSVGLEDKVEVKAFDTDDENRIRGCYTSHISVLSDVVQANTNNNFGRAKNPFDSIFGVFMPNDKEMNYDDSKERDLNILVLEDNLALNGDQLKQGILDSIAQYMRTDPEWDMILLSYIPYVPDLKVTKTESRDIVKLSCGVGSALGTTAYIINTRAIKTLLEDDKENGGFYLPIPDVMAKIFPESRYSANPTIFVRAPDTKSLVNPRLDDLRSLLFQPVVAGFAQQLLIWTGLTTNALLPITILSLVAASVASIMSSFDSMRMLLTTGTFDGPIVFPLISASFALFSLAVLAKGAMLAPKQEETS